MIGFLLAFPPQHPEACPRFNCPFENALKHAVLNENVNMSIEKHY